MRERIPYLDALRCLAIFLVVLLHNDAPVVVNTACYGRPSWYLCMFLDGAVRLGVPLFFMISGSLLLSRPEAAELVAPCLDAVLGWATREFDLVVVDTSTTFTDAVAQAVQRADRLLLVSDGRSGTTSAVARMSGLAVRLGVARTRIARVENRVDPKSGMRGATARPEVGLEAARVYRLVEGGDEVDELVAAGRVGELCEPGYPFPDSVLGMLAQLLAELGCLPDAEEARRAYEAPQRRRSWRLFGPRREAS